jgi:hypothetical protein
MLKKSFIFCLLIIGTFEGLFAQSFYSVRRERSLMVMGGTGTSSYFGELNNPGDYIDAKPNLTFGFQYFFGQRISGRAEVCWFQLSGDDADADRNGRVKRNLSFTSNNYEVSVTGAFHLIPMSTRYYQRPRFNVYAFGGVALLYFNPKATLNGEKHALRPLMTEGVKYSRFQFVIPYGVGGKIKINPFFNVAVEAGYRLAFTDYLDDVSTVHPDKSTWTDPIAIALSDRGPEVGLAPRPAGAIRGNPSTNDGYFLLNMKLEYYLPLNFTIGDPSRKLYNQKRRASHR